MSTLVLEDSILYVCWDLCINKMTDQEKGIPSKSNQELRTENRKPVTRGKPVVRGKPIGTQVVAKQLLRCRNGIGQMKLFPSEVLCYGVGRRKKIS